MHGSVGRKDNRPPLAARRPDVSVHHGVELRDDYAWLRAANWQDVMRDPSLLDAEIRAYLEQENAYCEAELADTRLLQETLFSEMKARLKQDDSTVPTPDGAFDYYSTFVAGGQYPRLCRRPRDGGAGNPNGGGTETLLLDGNAEAEGKPYWDLGARAHSPDHKLLAYSFDDKGSELFTIRFRDMETGKDLADEIPDTRGEIEWSNDGRTLFYIRVDANHRPLYVCRHRIGTPATDDVLVYEEKDIGYYTGLGKTLSGRFILVDAHDHQTNEIYLVDADKPEGPAQAHRRARPRPRVSGRAPRRPADHHHQLRRRRGLPHLRGPGLGSRHGELARDPAAQARPSHSRYGCLQGPPRASRARGQPAAHHHPLVRGRRRACHRLRRGGLLARHVVRLRVRHHQLCASATRP